MNIVESGADLAFTPYELRHLAAHLVAAERYADLHRLLAWETGNTGENMWYQACAQAGEIAGYLDDVHRGWNAAVAGLGADAVDCLALQVRYALIAATLGSLAGAVPPSLMVELVRTGVWTVEQAVEAARRVPDPEQRVEAVMGVASVPGLPLQELDRLWQESLAAAEAITDVYRRAGVLARLAITLPERLQERIYRTPLPSPEEIEILYATGAISTGRSASVDDHSEAQLVRSLIHDMAQGTPESLDDAFEVAQALTGELQRTLAFAQVVPRLVEHGRRVDAEQAVARLTGTDRAAQGRQRITAARAASDRPFDHVARDAPRWQAELLAEEVADSAEPSTAAREALAVSTHVGDSALVDELVATGARLLLEAGYVEEAVSEVGTLHSPRWLARALLLLARSVGPMQSPDIESLAARLDDPTAWAEVLLTLPSNTADEAARRRELVSRRRQEIAGPASRAELSAMLGVRSPESEQAALFRDAARCVLQVIDPNARARATAEVLRHAPEAVAFLDAQNANTHPSQAALVREAFARALAQLDQPDEAVRLVQEIVDCAARHSAAYSLAVDLATAGHVMQALHLAVGLPEPFLTPDLIRSLVASRVPEVVSTVCTLVEAMADPARRAMALAEVAWAEGTGPGRVRAENALTSAIAAGEDQRIVVALLAAARLGIAVTELRRSVDALTGESVRALGLAVLALFDGADDPLKALDSLTAVDRIMADLLLATLVDGRQLVSVLADATSLLPAVAGDPQLRLRLLTTLRPDIPLPNSTMTDLWTGSLDMAGRQERPTALETVRSMQGLALALGGKALIASVGMATRQVALWWP